jgi:hypothetical protein
MYETPLYLAALEGQESAASLLLDNGALVSVTDEALNTPLHAAAAGGHVGIAALLLERGGNPRQTNEVSLTTVNACARVSTAACACMQLVCVQRVGVLLGMLLQPMTVFPCCPCVCLQSGVSPLQVAEGRGDHIMEAVLAKADGTLAAGCGRRGSVLLRPLRPRHSVRTCSCRSPLLDVPSPLSEPVPCQQQCGQVVLRCLMAAHVKRDCPHRVMSCRLFCGEEVRRFCSGGARGLAAFRAGAERMHDSRMARGSCRSAHPGSCCTRFPSST